MAGGSSVVHGPPRAISAWQDQWRQLGLQSWAAESDCRREVWGGSASSSAIRVLTKEQAEELRNEASKNEEETRQWEAELWSDSSKCRKRVNALARNVQFVPRGTDDVKSMVQAVEREIRIYAEQARQQFDELAAQECALESTVDSALTRFEGWCSQASALGKPTVSTRCASTFRPPSRPHCSSASQRSASCGIAGKKAVKTAAGIQEQIDQLSREDARQGGLTGGWVEDDHNTFLRLFSKYKRKADHAFVEEAKQLLPHVTHEDLVGHVEWLRHHGDRQRVRRELIDQWRGLRATSVSSSGGAFETGAVEMPPDRAIAEIEEERRQRTMQKNTELDEQGKRKQQVAEWKRAREERRRQIEAAECNREKQGAERDANARQQRVDGAREAVASYRQRKEVEAASLAAASTPTRRPLTAEEKRRIAERNALQLEKRKEAATAAIPSHGFDTPPRVSKGDSIYRHVDSRIHSHTEAYIEKIRGLRADESCEDAASAKKNGDLFNFAHQAVVRPIRSSPSWRPHFGV